MIRSLSALAGLMIGIVFFLIACGSRAPGPLAYASESVVYSAAAGPNSVAFGASVDPRHYPEVLAAIEAQVAGRLPGVRFELFRYPLRVYYATGRGTAHSFRTDGLIVLSWWVDDAGVWRFGDLAWEVEHLVAGTDDNGNHWIH